MKPTRTILLILAGFLIIYLMSAIAISGNYSVVREREVRVPQNIVFGLVSHLEKWPSWSPWQEKDPGIKYLFAGQEGKEGQTMDWTGDPDLSGKGSLTITGLQGNTAMQYALNFKEPFKSKSDGAISLRIIDYKTTMVKWSNQGKLPFLFRPIGLFMNMDKMMGPDFERGLARLDSVSILRYAESIAKDFENLPVKINPGE